MARTRTDAAERTRQNQRLVEQVSAELGRRVTVREAQAHRRAQRDGTVDTPRRGSPRGGGESHLIPDRELDLTDEQVEYIGKLIAKVEDFKIMRGVTASLSLTTSIDFRHLLVDAATVSRSELLVCVLYKIPRNLGLDDDEDDDA